MVHATTLASKAKLAAAANVFLPVVQDKPIVQERAQTFKPAPITVVLVEQPAKQEKSATPGSVSCNAHKAKPYAPTSATTFNPTSTTVAHVTTLANKDNDSFQFEHNLNLWPQKTNRTGQEVEDQRVMVTQAHYL